MPRELTPRTAERGAASMFAAKFAAKKVCGRPSGALAFFRRELKG
jgi:hypothetical protein